MKKIALIFLILGLTAGCALKAQNPGSFFVKANIYYEKAMYNEALQQYRNCLDEGYQAWELYYNMGNAYYRLVDYPHAILYYEKALKLAPKNRDIQYNLSLAESKILDRINPLPRIFLYTWWEKLCGMFGPTTWAVLVLVFFASALASNGLYFYTRNYTGKRVGFYLSLVFTLLFILALVFGFGRYRQSKVPSAVIMEQSVNIQSSPEPRSETKFILHEGSKVRIEDQVGPYAKVRAKNGSRGWVLKESIEEI